MKRQPRQQLCKHTLRRLPLRSGGRTFRFAEAAPAAIVDCGDPRPSREFAICGMTRQRCVSQAARRASLARHAPVSTVVSRGTSSAVRYNHKARRKEVVPSHLHDVGGDDDDEDKDDDDNDDDDDDDDGDAAHDDS